MKLAAFCALVGVLSDKSFAELPDSSDLSGWAVYLGPSAAWESGEQQSMRFGGSLGVFYVSESSPLASVGIHAGAYDYAEVSGFGVGFGVRASTRLSPSIHLGLGLGGQAKLDSLGRNKYASFIEIWAYAGISPFFRYTVQPNRSWIMGLDIPLPVFRKRPNSH